MDEKYHVHPNTSEIIGQRTCADIGYYCGKVHWPPRKKTKKGFAVKLLAFCVGRFWGVGFFGFWFRVLQRFAGDGGGSENERARDVPPAAHLLCCFCFCRRLRGSNFSCCTT
jgi:hypothetical protein